MTLEAGKTLDRYEIIRLLGKGGMGEVYLARDLKLGRQVALKLLPAEFAGDDERQARFEQEARAVAALRHANIVTLHSIEEAEDTAFLVMELVDGRPLGELIPRSGLPLDRFLEIAIPLADALAAAHAAGITHRDLKPANILIDGEGQPRILDFGLAKMARPAGLEMEAGQPTEALTGEGRVVGTLAYMSPEQVEGRDIDSRSDLFSLGILFYEMVTGVRPFDGDTGMSVMSAIMRDEPVSVTEHNKRLPRYLGRIVKRCLQKDPQRRFQTALDLRNDLTELKDELASGELGTPATTGRPPGARPRWPFLAGALGVLGLAALWWALGGEGRGETEPEHVVRRLQVRGNPVEAAVSPDGRYVVYESRQGEESSLRIHQIASGSDIELVPPTSFGGGFGGVAFTSDGEYVRYVLFRDGGAGQLFVTPVLGGSRESLARDVLIGPAYSPDDTRIAFVPGAGFNERWKELVIASVPDGERRTILELPEGGADIENIHWSPDGSRLAIVIGDAEGDRLHLLSPENGDLVAVPGPAFFFIGEVCWAPHGREVIVQGTAHPGNVASQPYLVDPDSGARRRLFQDFNDYNGCSTTADGGALISIRNQLHSQIWVVPVDDPEAARAVSTTTGRSDGSDPVVWMADNTLVYAAPDGDTWNLFRVPAAGGSSERLSSKGAATPSASRDGRLVFESGWGIEGRQGIYTLDPAGRGQIRVSPEGQFADRPTISPDGRWVFYELLRGERMQLVRAPLDGGEPVLLTDDLAHLISVSPDGTRVALHVRDPQLNRWQTAIFPVDSSPGDQRLDFHSETYSPWADNESLYVSRTVDGASNIFRVRLDDLSEEQITRFADGEIFSFSVSPGLDRLAVGRGTTLNDLLLIEGALDPIR